METAYLLLVITAFLYGFTKMITLWGGFEEKIFNSIIIIAIITLTLLTGYGGFFYSGALNLLCPFAAILVGLWISDAIDSEDWTAVAGVLGAIGLIATIITTCCGV